MDQSNYVKAFRQRVLRSLTDANTIAIKLSKALDKNTVGWVYGLYKEVAEKAEFLEYENLSLKKKIAQYEKIIQGLTQYAGRKNHDYKRT